MLISISVMLLSSCSINEDRKIYYQLSIITPDNKRNIITHGDHLLWVEQVTVPDYLSGNGIVYQTSDVQYVIASNNLWATPLVQQLRNTLVSNLSNCLSNYGWIISWLPLGDDQDIINVNVTNFHGYYDGHILISGEWLLNHHGKLTKKIFYFKLKQQKDGYDEMIKILSEGWRKEAVNIASEIIRLS